MEDDQSHDLLLNRRHLPLKVNQSTGFPDVIAKELEDQIHRGTSLRKCLLQAHYHPKVVTAQAVLYPLSQRLLPALYPLSPELCCALPYLNRFIALISVCLNPKSLTSIKDRFLIDKSLINYESNCYIDHGLMQMSHLRSEGIANHAPKQSGYRTPRAVPTHSPRCTHFRAFYSPRCTHFTPRVVPTFATYPLPALYPLSPFYSPRCTHFRAFYSPRCTHFHFSSN